MEHPAWYNPNQTLLLANSKVDIIKHPLEYGNSSGQVTESQ